VLQVAGVMRPDSFCVFTVESCPEGVTEKGFRLLKNGRFGYCKSYMDKMVASMGPDFSIAT
jgi:predicted TPR repeat methyltransferase